eukprot:jgi/Botrbrau1/12458/Bobra.0169s0006.1
MVVGSRHRGRARPTTERPLPVLGDFQDTNASRLALSYSHYLRPYQVEEDRTPAQLGAPRDLQGENFLASHGQGHSPMWQGDNLALPHGGSRQRHISQSTVPRPGLAGTTPAAPMRLVHPYKADSAVRKLDNVEVHSVGTSIGEPRSRIVGRQAPLIPVPSRTCNRPAKHGFVREPCGNEFHAGPPGFLLGQDLPRVVQTDDVECPVMPLTHSPKCCSDHVEASEAGHVDCLWLFRKSGRFLPFGIYNRAFAGEARRDQAWQAVSAACRAHQPHALGWLLASGWPTGTKELAVGDLQDTVSSWDGVRGWEYPRPEKLALPPLHELNVYRRVMKSPTSACLEVLLKAGCRSPWICAIAADEGKADFLALAAKRGCPCRLWAMPAAARSGNPTVVLALYEAWRHYNAAAPFLRCARDIEEEEEWIWISVREAAHLGHASCLEALLRCFGKWESVHCSFQENLVETAVMCAARGGHVQCLDVILRSGLPTYNAWCRAAFCIDPACLDYLRPRYSDLLREHALLYEARAGRTEILRDLHEQGYAWSGYEPRSAAMSGSVEALKYCLDHVQPRRWNATMEEALRSRSPGCVQLLLTRGFLKHSMNESDRYDSILEEVFGILRPALGIKHCSLPCLEVFLNNSSSLPVAMSAICFEACEGHELLKCLRERGVPFHPDTAADAAAAGRHESLRYSLDNGAHWGPHMFINAIVSGSVECLQCAHLHACKVRGRDALESVLRNVDGPPAANLAVLRYVCEHMDTGWAPRVLSATAEAIAVRIGAQGKMGQEELRAQGVHCRNGVCPRSSFIYIDQWHDFRAQKQVDWKLVLYVARKLATPLPAALQAAVAPRKARAAAFAGVLYRARRLPREGRPVQLARLWDALARLPSELSQRIASEAHLVLPVLP